MIHMHSNMQTASIEHFLISKVTSGLLVSLCGRFSLTVPFHGEGLHQKKLSEIWNKAFDWKERVNKFLNVLYPVKFEFMS